MPKTPLALVGLEWDLVDLIESLPQIELIGLIDHPPKKTLTDLAYLGPDEDWPKIQSLYPHLKVALTVDRFKDRVRLWEHYGLASHLTLVSPFAYVSKRAQIGPGTLVQRDAKIMPEAHVGACCKINIGATVHHESQVGNFCTLAPNCQVLGRVILEDGVYVGAGAVIRQNCRIGTNVVIGAGAVVVRDIPPNQTVVGVPAKELIRK